MNIVEQVFLQYGGASFWVYAQEWYRDAEMGDEAETEGMAKQ